MRILHIDPDDMDNPLSGGGPVRTFEIYRRLARKHQVTVLTPTFPGSTPEKWRDGIRYLRLGRRIGNHGSSHHITFFFSFPRAIKRFKFDLLVEDFMPPMSITFTPLVYRGPLVASVQWFMAEMLSRKYKLPFFWGERYGMKLYKNFVVLTSQMQKLIVSRNPRANCAVIPNAVDDSLFSLQIKTDNFILYLGRIEFLQKGVDLLLEAYKLIPAQSRLPLVIAGGGYHEDQLKSKVIALQLETDVHLAGKVGVIQRNELLSKCKFVCVPSRDETFGMVILEACAAGKRVVFFDKWPMNEVAPIGPCLAVPPFDTHAYAIAMFSLIKAGNKEMKEQGLLCRELARKHSWDSVAAQQEVFYEQILNNWNASQ